ncbi:hypothetical protein LTR66_006512 [Elasticomyces elasticus]|nr:hypothetical protein LTR66_006512 [Elasticomyces elasticus]
MSAIARSTDPWDWTFDEIAGFFRNDTGAPLAHRPRSVMPNVDLLLENLQGNDVDGSTLLLDVDQAFLRESCNIRKLGERSSVLWCIKYLRRESPKYRLYGADSQSPKKQRTPETLREAEATFSGDQSFKTEVDFQPKNSRVTSEAAEYNERQSFNNQPEQASSVGTHVRQGEILVEKDGRKRRKLLLPTGTHAPTVAVANQIESVQRAFLPDTKINPTSQPSEDVEDFGDLNGEDLATVALSAPIGAIRYAYSQLKHHLVNPGDTTVRAKGPAQEWDFLLDKYEQDQDSVEALPLYGESGSEAAGYSTSDDKEIEADMEEPSPKATLPAAEVVEIMRNAISTFRDAWKQKLPVHETKKAWSTWRQCKHSRTKRRALVQGARVQIERLNKRLAVHQEEILAQEWRDPRELMKQCEILEPTVTDEEELRWKISVWERRDEPHHEVKRRAEGPSTGKSSEKIATTETRDSPVGAHSASFMDIESLAALSIAGSDGEDSPTSFQTAPVTEQHPASSPPPMPEDTPMPDDSPMVFDGSQPRPGGSRMRIDDSRETSAELPSVHTAAHPPEDSTKKAPVIDLTLLTSDPSSPLPHTFDAKPQLASRADVLGWNVAELQEREDRKRLLMSWLVAMDEGQRQRLKQHTDQMKEKDFEKEIMGGIAALNQVKGNDFVSSAGLNTPSVTMGILYVRWYSCSHSYKEGGIPRGLLAEILNEASHNDCAAFYNFLKVVLRRHDLFSEDSIIEIDSDEEVDSDEDLENLHAKGGQVASIADGDATRKKHRKRVKKVKKQTLGINLRESAQKRQEKFFETQTTDPGSLTAMIPGSDIVDATQIPINPTKESGHESIYVHPHIARRMKPHQLDGVWFLWREIVAAGDSERQGCVLAHTMGLGKTMQAITLLVTIAEASRSKNPGISDQIPACFKKSRTLIICPPALLPNWRQELEFWVPSRGILGTITTLDASVPAVDRLKTIERWSRESGLLLMGYSLFEKLVNAPIKTYSSNAQAVAASSRANNATARPVGRPPKGGIKISFDVESVSRNPGVAEANARKMRELLLESPNLIIADEAHILKSETSGVSKAASLFSSHSRIALTGTPMSNNLQEIYELVNWVAPNYLGGRTEFRAHFREPIEQGTYKESTAYERRKSIKRLQVLKHDIDPKVNRASIEVLKGSLKPKVEFMITVPLTPLQEEAYNIYVDAILKGLKTEVANTKLWGWLAVLMLLTNHPQCFRDKLTERRKDTTAATSKRRDASTAATPVNDTTAVHSLQLQKQDMGTFSALAKLSPKVPGSGVQTLGSEDDDTVPGDEHVSTLGITDELVKRELECFDRHIGYQNSTPKQSHKVSILLQILHFSKDASDRVLVFSHSIQTLNYLEKLFTNLEKKFVRIDGTVAMRTRTERLEQFDKGDFDVFLISTRAGGLGFNICRANRVVIFDFGFNPQWEEQAIGRAYRLGQQKPVFVYRFVAGGTFESNIDNKAIFKHSLASRVVDKKNPERHAEKNFRDYLYAPQKVLQEQIGIWKGKDPEVLDKILAQHDVSGRDCYIRAIKTMETLQEESKTDAPLTAEELKEIQQEIEEETLRRNDPERWQRQTNARDAAEQLRMFHEAAARVRAPNMAPSTMSSRPWVPPSGPTAPSSTPRRYGLLGDHPAHARVAPLDRLGPMPAPLGMAVPRQSFHFQAATQPPVDAARRHRVDNVKQQTSPAGKIPSTVAQSPNAMGVQTPSAPGAQENNGKTGPLGVEPNPK